MEKHKGYNECFKNNNTNNKQTVKIKNKKYVYITEIVNIFFFVVPGKKTLTPMCPIGLVRMKTRRKHTIYSI